MSTELLAAIRLWAAAYSEYTYSDSRNDGQVREFRRRLSKAEEALLQEYDRHRVDTA